MPTITPFIPTREELENYERMQARDQSHTQSTTGAPAAPAQGFDGTTISSGTSSSTASGVPAHGGHAPAQPHALVQTQAQPRPPLAQFVLTAQQLAALVIPPRPALLDRWLCQGDLGYIFAPRGVGKTWMAMALPGAISSRRPLGLWQAGSGTGAGTAPSISASSSTGSSSDSSSLSDAAPASDSGPIPVLYVDGEMALQLTQYRAHGLDLSHVHHLHHEHLFNANGSSLNIGEAEDRQRITDLLVQQGYQVLILDNLSSLASGIDENKGMDYEPISHWLLELRRRKITVIVIHHAGRNGFMRGHTKREDACSWILELRDARQEADPGAKFVSHFTKPSRNTGEPLPDLLWHFTTDKVSGITDIKCELSIESEYEQFIQHVCEGVTSQKDISEMMDKNKGTVSKWARRALNEGLISGSAHKLLPPSTADKTCAKSFYDPTENDDGDDDANNDQ
ncbi:AAA family ATPase [Prosthecobacter sp.]|uniref:AAA family ATPase n=1 Tax=Prosthecobacter sp. TaxID=1965333 RepID=UPI0037838267